MLRDRFDQYKQYAARSIAAERQIADGVLSCLRSTTKIARNALAVLRQLELLLGATAETGAIKSVDELVTMLDELGI